MRRQSRSMVKRTPPLSSWRASDWMLASRRVSSLPPSQIRKPIMSSRNSSQSGGLFPVALRARSSKARTTICTTKASMPPREPERKMVPAIRAAIAGHDQLAVSVGKAGHGQHQRKGSEHLHQSGVVIVVDVGAVDHATLFAEARASRACRWEQFPGVRQTTRARLRSRKRPRRAPGAARSGAGSASPQTPACRRRHTEADANRSRGGRR